MLDPFGKRLDVAETSFVANRGRRGGASSGNLDYWSAETYAGLSRLRPRGRESPRRRRPTFPAFLLILSSTRATGNPRLGDV